MSTILKILWGSSGGGLGVAARVDEVGWAIGRNILWYRDTVSDKGFVRANDNDRTPGYDQTQLPASMILEFREGNTYEGTASQATVRDCCLQFGQLMPCLSPTGWATRHMWRVRRAICGCAGLDSSKFDLDSWDLQNLSGVADHFSTVLEIFNALTSESSLLYSMFHCKNHIEKSCPSCSATMTWGNAKSWDGWLSLLVRRHPAHVTYVCMFTIQGQPQLCENQDNVADMRNMV